MPNDPTRPIFQTPALLRTHRGVVGADTRVNMRGMTAQQRALMDYIVRFICREGISPSYDEMKDHMGLASKSGINRLVTSLEDRGILVRNPNKARSIYPTANYIAATLSSELISLVVDIGVEDAVTVLREYRDA